MYARTSTNKVDREAIGDVVRGDSPATVDWRALGMR